MPCANCDPVQIHPLEQHVVGDVCLSTPCHLHQHVVADGHQEVLLVVIGMNGTVEIGHLHVYFLVSCLSGKVSDTSRNIGKPAPTADARGTLFVYR